MSLHASIHTLQFTIKQEIPTDRGCVKLHPEHEIYNKGMLIIGYSQPSISVSRTRTTCDSDRSAGRT